MILSDLLDILESHDDQDEIIAVISGDKIVLGILQEVDSISSEVEVIAVFPSNQAISYNA